MLRSQASDFVPPASPIPLGLDDAMALAVREMKRLGLVESHKVRAFYAAPDLHTEGADFAATLVPRSSCKASDTKDGSNRFKLLIQCDGRVSVCPFAKRCSRSCKAASGS
jgi:hypothetical protein